MNEPTPRQCRFIGGPEDGRKFTMTGFAVSIGMGAPNGRYYPQRGTDGYIDYTWREAGTARPDAWDVVWHDICTTIDPTP